MFANNAYWLTHNDWTGEPFTSERVAGVMVATAVLADLLEAGAVGIIGGEVVATLPPPKPLDPVGGGVVGQVAAEYKRYPVGKWLEFLGLDVCRRVAERMVAEGLARVEKVGWRRQSAVVAAERDLGAAWVRAGLATAIVEGMRLTDEQYFLLRLAQYSSLSQQVFTEVPPAAVENAYADAAFELPHLKELLDAAVNTILAAALTH
ncbi:MAG TPA: GPP34 family phosphoprotein [Actinoplanes sp.]|jgi:hypothetical protein